MKNKIIVVAFLIVSLVFATNYNFVMPRFLGFKSMPKNEPKASSKAVKVQASKFNKTTKTFTADIPEGSIGVADKSDTDTAYDNVFHLQVSQLPSGQEYAYLEYELFGYDQAASVARSLNNQPSIGGRFLSEKKGWNHQSELLSEQSLRKGDNVILFTAPDVANNLYRVKNIKIVYKSIATADYTLLQSGDKLYIKGANFPSKIKKITIAGIAIDLNQPEFELVLSKTPSNTPISLVQETMEGKIIKKEIALNQFLEVPSFRNLETSKESISRKVKPETASSISYKELLLDFPIGAVKSDLAVSVRGLRKIDIAPLNSAMVNVTGDVAGYRLLPHGTIFEKAVTLRLPFDKKEIPEGYTEKDINVFYFDECKRLWQEVAKDSLDVKKGVITAKTTHFTDFIAGIIKMPESPETSGYTPTSIKDLKAASPLVGIQSIAPPSANSRGTANTSFNIEIPKGRGGMQPALGLRYDSDGAHSWAGMGWDLSAPSINIDTRWGVPRYDAGLETETYSMAGEMLLPNSHRENWVARTVDKQFYPRREGAFQQIIRKGSAPSNYYWVVKDKSGVASYYGGTTSGLETNGILQDASGNVGHWALCLQVDLKGNTVSYEYDKKDGELYLKKVYYTGFGTEKGNYSVTFVKDSDLGEVSRPDVQVSARLGFRQNCNVLLRKIEVRYKDQMIRSYQLNYTLGAFKKTLLKDIAQYDSESKLFYTNSMDYFDDVRDASGKYNPFGPEQIWSVPNDGLTNSIAGSPIEYSGHHTLAGSSSGSSKGINYRLAVGLITDYGSFKGNTLGGHGGNGWGKSETAIMLEDLDGDQLPDKVFKTDSGVFYRKNLSNLGQNAFGEIQKLNLGNIGNSKSSSFNWGVDLVLSYGASITLGYDKQYNTNKTKSYFMDFNGDGLVDFVDGGQVYYNRLQNGVPTFIANSTGTPSPVSGDGSLQLTGSTNLITADDLLKKNPLHDVVRVWEAPVTGTISVTHKYQLLTYPFYQYL
jgi:hypothetical protein